MAENSHIEWTDHTFNPWWGCTHVSRGCDNCYAEDLALRFRGDIWGPGAPRHFLGSKVWEEPLKWNSEAAAEFRRARVFCASMSDVFEHRPDLLLDHYRKKLWQLIADTPNLDWLLLTKRPQNVGRMVPWGDNWPKNVWLGTSVEDQENADKRIPQLIKYPAKVRFLSCEPLLGPVDLSGWIKPGKPFPVHWVIAGGESGPGARAMRQEWVDALQAFSAAHKVAFHFKQWGKFVPDKI